MTEETNIGAENFAAKSRRALANADLQRAMSIAAAKFFVAQKNVASDVLDWEHLRQRAREIKAEAISHLDLFLTEFSANVERQGGHVFWATDAMAANAYIVELARSHGVKLVVKGKSAMSEELGLNVALTSAGIEALETDLGEYIVQLAGERPSHINMPAIHKTRREIAALIAASLGSGYTEDIVEMITVVRHTLRQRFAAAGMGITGVNFAVAETGSIVLLENEGNIRMTTSLPRIHVAIMGIEKIVPRFMDLEVFLSILPLSASGQKITASVSLLTGVKRTVSEEGPEELHVIIVDNGRSEILANPRLRESLYCIRCGACLNACPVYQKIGGHSYGWVYSGPIGALLTPQLIGRERASELPFASTLCGACRDVCPVKMNIPEMLVHLRREINEPEIVSAEKNRLGANAIDGNRRRRELSRSLKFQRVLARQAERAAVKLWMFAMKNVIVYRLACRLARLAEKTFGHQYVTGLRSLPISRWTATRDLPSLSARSFRDQWPQISNRKSEPPT